MIACWMADENEGFACRKSESLMISAVLATANMAFSFSNICDSFRLFSSFVDSVRALTSLLSEDCVTNDRNLNFCGDEVGVIADFSSEDDKDRIRRLFSWEPES